MRASPRASSTNTSTTDFGSARSLASRRGSRRPLWALYGHTPLSACQRKSIARWRMHRSQASHLLPEHGDRHTGNLRCQHDHLPVFHGKDGIEPRRGDEPPRVSRAERPRGLRDLPAGPLARRGGKASPRGSACWRSGRHRNGALEASQAVENASLAHAFVVLGDRAPVFLQPALAPCFGDTLAQRLFERPGKVHAEPPASSSSAASTLRLAERFMRISYAHPEHAVNRGKTWSVPMCQEKGAWTPFHLFRRERGRSCASRRRRARA